MKKVVCDVLVIGGGPAGGVSAVTAKMNYPQKEILVVREFEIQLVPCAIPYIFGETLGCSENDVASCGMAETMGISTLLGRIEKVDIGNKIAFMKGYEITFDKLIFATGSEPFVHSSLKKSLDLEGVFTVPKNKTRIDALKEYTDKKEKIVVIGSGFIGIEIAVEFAGNGKDVTVIGGSKHILKNAFDTELGIRAEALILEHKVKYIGEDRLIEVLGEENKVASVCLESGKVLDADVVILATGYEPNTTLAQESGLILGHYGGIWVDEYMRTQNHDIFAVGDCSYRRDFITKEASKVMLASTSSAEGRVAGSSLFGIKYLKGFSGTLAIFSTMIGKTAFSSAGVTETQAKEAGIDVVVGAFEGLNRHPATIPNAQKQFVKLVVMKHGGQIIGGQIIGGEETGEMINLIGLIIESHFDVYKVMSMQVATQPMLTAAPTSYPVIMASVMATKMIELGKSDEKISKF
ncbi:FAD-dependent pyridine nucleotide-disulphide oxidoreductase [hydrothermal vent metagenome]|uniref:FAD-dependent pyridine nucleotide-disulphide oxidoreductase n=1 Tax=hydrothermal vent metagenome TaxID=652676 RepID=A0A1W1D139_9ZZZZ